MKAFKRADCTDGAGTADVAVGDGETFCADARNAATAAEFSGGRADMRTRGYKSLIAVIVAFVSCYPFTHGR